MKAALVRLALAFVLTLTVALPLEAQSSGFTSNNYAIDLFTGPVLGASRIVGMGGAYGAIATGIDGSMINPAGFAERAEEELEFWEWDLTGSIALGGLFRRNDVDNNGRKNDLVTDEMLLLSVGGRLQFANSGTGITILSQSYTMRDENGAEADVSFDTLRLGTAYAFLQGSLVVGGALRVMSFEITEDTGRRFETLVGFEGIGGEVGVLVRPAHKRYRVAAVGRSPVSSRPAEGEDVKEVNGVRQVRGFVLPREVHVPWELDVGFAYQFGERRTNVPWRHTRDVKQQLKRELENGAYQPPPTHGGPPWPPLPQDPRAALRKAVEHDRESARRFIRHQPRRYVLISADLLLYGPTHRGQGVAAFLTQTPERSGENVSVGFRTGIESEFLPNRLKMRAGAYLEPSRFSRAHYRPHGTFGSDVRLFDAWDWSIRATATIDVAPRYFDWGLSVGFWY